MLDFISFKEQMGPKHLELVKDLKKVNSTRIKAVDRLEAERGKKESLTVSQETSVKLVNGIKTETKELNSACEK